MVRVRVTRDERRQFRNDMKEYRQISAAYTSLLDVKVKDVKSPAEHQAALGQSKLQDEQTAEKFYLIYNKRPVVESVLNHEQKIRNRGVLAFVVSVALTAYLFKKGAPVSQESIQEFFQHNVLQRAGSVLSVTIAFVSLFLIMPLEARFSGRPSETFRSISHEVEKQKREKESSKP